MKARAPFAILLGCVVAFMPLACGRPGDKNIKSELAPDFTLPTFSGDPSELKLSQLTATNPVLLVFWASWCPSCVEEIPEVNEWYEKFSGRGLKILGINVQESKEEISDFIKSMPIKYPVLMDQEGDVADSYGLAGLPAAIFVAKGGKVLYYGFSLPQEIDELIQKGDPDKNEP